MASGSVAVQVFTEFSGLDEIVKTSKKRAVALKAVKAGAKIVLARARSTAPKRKGSGALKFSLGIKAVKGTRGKTLSFAVVGARTKVERSYRGRTIKPSKYASLVERGTRAHSLGKGSRLARARKKVLVAAVVVAGKKHPGARPRPYLKPSLDTQRQAISSAILRVLGEEILKVKSGKKDARGGRR